MGTSWLVALALISSTAFADNLSGVYVGEAVAKYTDYGGCRISENVNIVLTIKENGAATWRAFSSVEGQCRDPRAEYASHACFVEADAFVTGLSMKSTMTAMYPGPLAYTPKGGTSKYRCKGATVTVADDIGAPAGCQRLGSVDSAADRGAARLAAMMCRPGYGGRTFDELKKASFTRVKGGLQLSIGIGAYGRTQKIIVRRVRDVAPDPAEAPSDTPAASSGT